MNNNKKSVIATFDHRPKTLQENDNTINSFEIHERKNIIYVSSNVPKNEAATLCNRLCQELPVAFTRVEHIKDIFPLLSNPYTTIDYIAIDIDDLCNQHDIDCFDIIRTLHTLINCTVCRSPLPLENFLKPKKRDTKIVTIVPDIISKGLLKEILSMTEIDFVSLRHGGRVDYSLLKRTVENYINNGEREPKFIMDLFKDAKPHKEKSSEIMLTARQHQIFDIVTTRGSSNKHIARMLSISESTVKLHVGAILKKYGLKSRTQLAVFGKKKDPMTEVHV